jgi:pSer/pThr/pTyr-binding forkhead associated (FHA) protein
MNFKLIKIGRSQDNDIVLEHASVSRHHAEIFIDAEGRVFIRDLNSANGTYINEQKISGGGQLHAGDVLQLGHEEKVDWQRMVKSMTGADAQAAPAKGGVFAIGNAKPGGVIVWSLAILAVLVVGAASYYFVFYQPDTPAEGKKSTVGSTTKAELTFEELAQAEFNTLDSLQNSMMIDFTGDSVLTSIREKSVLIYIVDGKFTNYREIGKRRDVVASDDSNKTQVQTEKVVSPSPAKEQEAPPAVKKEVTKVQEQPAPPKEKVEQPVKEAAVTESKTTAEPTTKSSAKSKSGQRFTYRVKKGDTLESIINAQSKQGCVSSARRIMDENGLNDATDFVEGDLLIISCQ